MTVPVRSIAGILAGGLLLLAGTIAAQGAERIVSIGGAVTETIHALGAGARITAVDSTSTYPAAMADLPQVGYMRQLSAEPIIALDPTLVLAVADAGPDATLEQLRAAGVRLITVPDEPSPDGVVAKVEAVAKAVGLEDEGEVLTARLMEDFAALDQGPGGCRSPAIGVVLAVGGAGCPAGGGARHPCRVDHRPGRRTQRHRCIRRVSAADRRGGNRRRPGCAAGL